MVVSCEPIKGTPAVQIKKATMVATSSHCDPQNVVWHKGIQPLEILYSEI